VTAFQTSPYALKKLSPNLSPGCGLVVARNYKETLEITKLPAYTCGQKCKKSSALKQSLFTKQRYNFSARITESSKAAGSRSPLL